MALQYLKISGGRPLGGEITIQGSKNAVLPILAACMLGDGVCVIENCPAIADVNDILKMMQRLGCRIEREGKTVCVDASAMDGYEIDGEEASRIRSSILFLGPLLGKMKKAVLPHPGGCAIGERPIDLHLSSLRALGAAVIEGEKVTAYAKMLCGTRIRLAAPSVGATENIILASVLACGETVIENAAQEPEIEELCHFLNLRGAAIVQTGGRIRIRGTKTLHAVTYRMRADRIVAGTYLLAAAAAGGRIVIRNFPHGQLDALLAVLCRMGVQFGCEGERIWLGQPGVLVKCADSSRQMPESRTVRYRGVNVSTAPYPGFPTDLQSPLMALLCTADGRSCICERIFENRFRTAEELVKMGAGITVEGNCALIRGVSGLHGAVVDAPDLRGGAALVIAALMAKGSTVIRGTEYIERGYEDIAGDLRSMGAEIRMTEETDAILL